MARVDEVGEFGLIDRIRSRRVVHDGDVVVGVGDDAAVIRRGPVLEVLTTDCLVEGTHYEAGWLTMKDVGWKVLAVNVSDVAAMGGTPKHALVTLFLPDDFTTGQVDDIYQGLEECGDAAGVTAVGGDIVKIRGPFAVSVTLSGICERDQLVLRSGARAGDVIVVTGSLGEASVGLRLLKEQTPPAVAWAEACMLRFRHPEARPKESRAIVEGLQPTSMIDISDGLLSDLWHLLDASNTGATLEADAIPIGPGVIDYFDSDREQALAQAVAGGEDYELLFTVGERFEGKLAEISKKIGLSLSKIGRITARGAGVRLAVDGREKDVDRGGFDHFRPVL